MDKRGLFTGLIILIVLLIVGFFWFVGKYESSSVAPVEIANPASVYCINQGHVLELRGEVNGSVGYCLTDDRQECEEWAFFRGKCSFEDSPRCVKDSCCHASGCVLESEATDCGVTICTMECREGTMDCGAGHCAFVDGNCEVIWDEE